MGDFRKLAVWRRAQALAARVYLATAELPGDERFGLTTQMRRAALSVTSNLAEGCGRRSDTELWRFIRISQGSLAELECQLLLATDLQYLRTTPVAALLLDIHEVRAMLDRLHAGLEARRKTRRPSDSRLRTKTLDS